MHKRGKKQYQGYVWQLILADLSVMEICQKFEAHCAGNRPEEFATCTFATNSVPEENVHRKNLLAGTYLTVFSLFQNYLPLGKGVAHHFNKLEPPLPKDA